MQFSRGLATILGIAVIGALAVALILGPLRHTDESAGSPTPTPSRSIAAAPSPIPDETQGSAATPGCRADQLGLVARGWDGATGSLVATALVVNVSNARCDLHGAPSIQLVDAGGSSITPSAAGVLPGDNVPLHTGEVALATVIWSNWCSPPPSLPLGLRLGLSQEGGTLTASIGTPGANDEDNLPRCDVPTAASSASALPFRAAEPTLGGGQIEACRADQLTAFVGEWGAAAGTNVTTLVVLNLGSVLVQDCRLPTSPIAELRDAAGHALAQSEAAADAGSIDLPGTGAAWTNLGFANWCADPPAEPLSIDLVVGLDEVLVAAIAPVPVAGCSGDPGSPAFFGHLNPLALP